VQRVKVKYLSDLARASRGNSEFLAGALSPARRVCDAGCVNPMDLILSDPRQS